MEEEVPTLHEYLRSLTKVDRIKVMNRFKKILLFLIICLTSVLIYQSIGIGRFQPIVQSRFNSHGERLNDEVYIIDTKTGFWQTTY